MSESDIVAGEETNIVVTNYSYNELDQLIKRVENAGSNSYSTTYEYDKNGNQTKVIDGKNGTVTENTYDPQSQLLSVKSTKDGQVKTQKNVYDCNGKRIRKTETDSATGTTKVINYYYDGNNLIYTTDENEDKTSSNIYGTEANVIATIRYTEDEERAYTYSKDIQGSTNIITNDEQQCVKVYEYTDYGETTVTVGEEFENEICYTGGIYDSFTGLYYLNARYYNPETGIFLSQDTYRGEEKDSKTWNLYAYCAGNPIAYVDPSGHFIETLFDIGSIGYSTVDLVRNPSWANLGYLAWDVGATIVPAIPGSYTAKGVKAVSKVSKGKKAKKLAKAGKVAIQVADKTTDFIKAKRSLTLGKYKVLKKGLRGVKGIEVHHIIEKRFVRGFKNGLKGIDMLSIPLTKKLHRKITNRWRKIVPYGTSLKKFSKKEMLSYCRAVYHDMPKLKDIATSYVNKNWR